MTDIVERLRAPSKLYNKGPDYEPITIEAGPLREEAAAEIERLRSLLAGQWCGPPKHLGPFVLDCAYVPSGADCSPESPHCSTLVYRIS